MSEGAVTRTPVEIWTRILQYAIRSPLDVIESQDILQSVEILIRTSPRSQEPHALQRQIEQMRTSLRLVCHNWNRFLISAASLHVSALIYSFKSHNGAFGYQPTFWPSRHMYKSASWIQINYECPSYGDIDHARKCRSPWCHGGSEQMPDDDITCPPSADIVLSNSYGEKNEQGFLASCPETLRVLRWSLYDRRDDALPIIRRFQQLTHLYLECTNIDPKATLSLLQLRVLWLDRPMDPVGPGPPERGEWRFPNLQHLRLDSQSTKNIVNDITHMSSAAPSITSLLIYCPYAQDLRIDAKFWASFPQLSILGLPSDLAIALQSEPRPIIRLDGNNTPFKLIITRFIEDMRYHELIEGRIHADRISGFAQSPVWRADTVVFDNSWGELGKRLQPDGDLGIFLARKFPRVIYDAFNLLRENRIEIYDRNGAGCQDPEGQAFFNEMDAYGERATAWRATTSEQ